MMVVQFHLSRHQADQQTEFDVIASLHLLAITCRLQQASQNGSLHPLVTGLGRDIMMLKVMILCSVSMTACDCSNGNDGTDVLSVHVIHLIHAEQCRVAADLWTNPVDLGLTD